MLHKSKREQIYRPREQHVRKVIGLERRITLVSGDLGKRGIAYHGKTSAISTHLDFVLWLMGSHYEALKGVII